MLSSLARRNGVNRVVLALSVARLGDAIGNSILFIVIPLYVAQLPAPWFPWPEPVRVGVLIALYGLVNSALQPFLGALSDRWGRRKPLIMGGLAVMALSTFLFIFANSFTDLLMLRALQGIGVALTIPASLAIMATATTRETRGGSMGVYSAMRMLGFAIGPLIGGLLYDMAGFNVAFVLGTV
jgi:MFS family permease